jgi:hypothetical protein
MKSKDAKNNPKPMYKLSSFRKEKNAATPKTKPITSLNLLSNNDKFCSIKTTFLFLH